MFFDSTHLFLLSYAMVLVEKAPKKSETTYYNYQGTFSIVIMALVDANYRFIYIDIGSTGKTVIKVHFKNA